MKLFSYRVINDNEVALMFIRQKNSIAQHIKDNPDDIKYVPDVMKRDLDILIASGMFDEDHFDAP